MTQENFESLYVTLTAGLMKTIAKADVKETADVFLLLAPSLRLLVGGQSLPVGDGDGRSALDNDGDDLRVSSVGSQV